MDKFIDNLNLPFTGEYNDNVYTIILKKSDDFSLAYDLISTNPELVIEDESIANRDRSKFTFYDDNYEAKLVADYNNDIYKVIVSRR